MTLGARHADDNLFGRSPLNMKAALLYQFDQALSGSEWLVYQDAPKPVIEKPTDVIVRIGGAGICGTDLQLIRGDWCGFMNIKLPLILGHESAGWVEETGPGVDSVSIGDPVIVHPLGEFFYPLSPKNTTVFQQKRPLFPGFNRNGGFAEYLLIEENRLARLPSHLSPMDVAPLADAGLTAYRAALKASKHLAPGQYVLVLGCGGLGHLGIQVLKTLTAAEIIAVDKSIAALDLAREVGAHYTFLADSDYGNKVLSLTRGRGVESVIDFVGEDATIEKGLMITRREGFYYLVGTEGRLSVSALNMALSGKTIVGILGGSLSELREILTMVDRGLVSLKSREYPLRKVNKALRDLKEGGNEGRAILIP